MLAQTRAGIVLSFSILQLQHSDGARLDRDTSLKKTGAAVALYTTGSASAFTKQPTLAFTRLHKQFTNQARHV